MMESGIYLGSGKVKALKDRWTVRVVGSMDYRWRLCGRLGAWSWNYRGEAVICNDIKSMTNGFMAGLGWCERKGYEKWLQGMVRPRNWLYPQVDIEMSGEVGEKHCEPGEMNYSFPMNEWKGVTERLVEDSHKEGWQLAIGIVSWWTL